MATPTPLSVHETARELGLAYQALQDAYCRLAQTEGCWPDELDEYLHEEGFNSLPARDFIRVITDDLGDMNRTLQRLALDTANLSNDLIRVGRGQSFSV